jgi:hypothetical protein
MKVNIFFKMLLKLGRREPGLPDFLDIIYQKGEKYTILPLNYQMAIKYTNWSYYIPKYTNPFQIKDLQNLPKSGFLV